MRNENTFAGKRRKNKANPFNTYKMEVYRIEKGMTIEEFCQCCEIRVKDYEKLLHNNLDIDLKVLFKIAKVMNINIVDLLCPEK